MLEKLVQVAFSKRSYAGSVDLHDMAIKITIIQGQVLSEVDKKVTVNANRKISQLCTAASSAESTKESNIREANTERCRSRWPRGLRHGFRPFSCLLGMRVRILFGTWMSVSCEC
jgi:hypothetical protein